MRKGAPLIQLERLLIIFFMRPAESAVVSTCPGREIKSRVQLDQSLG